MIYIILLVGGLVTGHVAWIIAALVVFAIMRWATYTPDYSARSARKRAKRARRARRAKRGRRRERSSD